MRGCGRRSSRGAKNGASSGASGRQQVGSGVLCPFAAGLLARLPGSMPAHLPTPSRMPIVLPPNAGFNDEEQEVESTANFTGRMWDSIDLNDVRRGRISEWVRLAKLVLTIPIGSVANERRA